MWGPVNRVPVREGNASQVGGVVVKSYLAPQERVRPASAPGRRPGPTPSRRADPSARGPGGVCGRGGAARVGVEGDGVWRKDCCGKGVSGWRLYI